MAWVKGGFQGRDGLCQGFVERHVGFGEILNERKLQVVSLGYIGLL